MAFDGPKVDRYTVAAVHPIRAFLWDRLSADLGMSKLGDPNNGIVPIIPSQQVPQVTQYAEPFIVYNWVTEPQGVDWYFQADQMIFLVYSEEEEEIRIVVNYMRDLFEKYDESARPINEWIANQSYEPYKAFHYKYINVLQGSGGVLPMETEDGRQESMITLHVTYTVER